jgi:acyl-CoA thioester hydrolase
MEATLETSMNLTQLPITYQGLIPESYLDEMGHMNVMWYTHLFSCATEGVFNLVGMTRDYFMSREAGTFALESHVRFLAEVRAGQRVSLRSRLLGRSAKLFHFLHFLVNDTTGALSSTGEFIGAHIDLRVRRTAPMPLEVTSVYDRILAEHQKLDWKAPVCGVMKC